jgi:hypothetical protein
VPSTARASDSPERGRVHEELRANSWSANDLRLEVFLIFNFISLTGDIALAHSENRFRVPAEYLPLWFSLAAALLLTVAFVARLRAGAQAAWRLLGHFVGGASIIVGTAGVIYHLDSQFFDERTLKSLTYTAPFAAPLAYVGLGCLLVMNRMVRPNAKEWSQWVTFFALGGSAGNFVLSLADHAANGFFHWTEWIPVVSSALAVGFLLVLTLSKPTISFLRHCAAAVVLQILVGALGFVLHAWADLHGPADTLFQNVIAGAPPFAPLLLPNLAILGFIGIVGMRRELSA